jgi:hypothetical protein
MKRFLFLTLGIFWATLGPVQAQAQAFDHRTWDGLLERHVRSIRGGVATQVDYAGMARERAALKGYLDTLAAVKEADFRRWPKNERLAFLINAYNAWTVELVLTAWPQVDSIKDLGSLLASPWKKSFIPLLGRTRSLDDIEHKLIRAKGVFDEPRIHFAVNCASVGCPALRPDAYTAKRLDGQLADATRSFLGDRSRNRLANGRLEVSSIFKWYGDDFERAGGLRAFLAGQGEALGLTNAERQGLRDGSLKIAFLDYDWRLNGTR